MTANPVPGSAGPGTGPNWRRRVLIALVSSLFLVSFIESYASLERAALTAQIPWPEAWPWQVDGFILATALMVIEARDRGRRWGVWWPRLGLFASTGLSAFIQAVYAPDGAWWLHAWSPLAVLFSFECLVWLTFIVDRPPWAIPTPTVPAPEEPTPTEPSGPEHPDPVPESRPRVAQGGVRRRGPATRGRPTAQVVQRAAQGQSAKRIAEDLGLSDRARKGWVADLVRTHRPTPAQMGHRNGDGGP